MSRTRIDAENQSDEFQIAGVGSLTSVVLAVLFGLLYWIGTISGWNVAVNGVTGYLASINLVLAIFNLLSGFPLDGGRLFRSIVWKITGLTKATRIASWGGKFLSYLIIALRVVQWTRRTLGDTMIPVEKGVLIRPDENMTQVLQKM